MKIEGASSQVPLPLVRRITFSSSFLRILPATPLFLSPPLPIFLLVFLGNSKSSVKEDAGDGHGGVGRQVGYLRRGPLVPLCAQAKPVDLRREKVVEDEHDRHGTALEVQLNLAILAAKVEPQLTRPVVRGDLQFIKGSSPERSRR